MSDVNYSSAHLNMHIHHGGEFKELHHGGELQELHHGGEFKELHHGGELQEFHHGGEFQESYNVSGDYVGGRVEPTPAKRTRQDTAYLSDLQYVY